MKGEKKDLLAYIREGHEMTQGEKLNLIIQLSIPSILAQISTVLMFFIDAAMVGHLGARQAASIGLVESASWLFVGLTSACSMGFSVQVAHAIGANDLKRARRILRQSLTCCLLFSLFLVVIAASLHQPLPRWLGGSDDIVADSSLYFLIFACAAPFFQMQSLFGSMLKCSGNMKIPSALNILMCCLDVTFNYLFIFIFDMGVPGAALGTTVAIFITTLMMGYFLFWRSDMLGLFGKKARDIQNPLYKFKPRADVVSIAFKIGAPMGAQHMLMNGAQIISTMIVAPLGTYCRGCHHTDRTEHRRQTATDDALVCLANDILRHLRNDGDGYPDVYLCSRTDDTDDSRRGNHCHRYRLSAHRGLRRTDVCGSHRLQRCLCGCWRHAETCHHESGIYVGRATDTGSTVSRHLRTGGCVDSYGYRTDVPRHHLPATPVEVWQMTGNERMTQGAKWHQEA